MIANVYIKCGSYLSIYIQLTYSDFFRLLVVASLTFENVCCLLPALGLPRLPFSATIELVLFALEPLPVDSM